MSKKSRIITLPDPILRQKAAQVENIDADVLKLITEMVKNLKSSKPEGVGLAAPQIGHSQRIFIIRFGKYYVPFINPEILESSEETVKKLEGCLSVPALYGEVLRAQEIKIKAQNQKGKTVIKIYKNLYARIFQHELDHLNGIVFIDRVQNQKGRLFQVVKNKKVNIVFFGSSKYSVLVAEALQKEFGLTAVITLPTSSPVQQFTRQFNLPVITAKKLDRKIIGKITSFKPDFLVIADYGLILPDQLLQTPKYAPLNVHHSLLPKYRGPSPAPTAILNGEQESGVTIIQMNDQIDAGDILTQAKYSLAPDETTDSLLTRLNTLGGQIIIPVIKNYLKGNAKSEKQDESKATFTKRFKKEDGYINLANTPKTQILDHMIRAYYPWPGVWTKINLKNQEKILKFLPGKLVQLEGKKPVTFKQFLEGYPHLRTILEKLL